MLQPTEKEVFSHEVVEGVVVAAYIGLGRSVALAIETIRVNFDASFEPHEARELAAVLLKAADAADQPNS